MVKKYLSYILNQGAKFAICPTRGLDVYVYTDFASNQDLAESYDKDTTRS